METNTKSDTGGWARGRGEDRDSRRNDKLGTISVASTLSRSGASGGGSDRESRGSWYRDGQTGKGESDQV